MATSAGSRRRSGWATGSGVWSAPPPRDREPSTRRPEILSRFAELVSLAISSAEAREQLSALASTDALTGLPNQRTFTERLRDELVRAGATIAPSAS